jgi:hypothetical protein
VVAGIELRELQISVYGALPANRDSHANVLSAESGGGITPRGDSRNLAQKSARRDP